MLQLKHDSMARSGCNNLFVIQIYPITKIFANKWLQKVGYNSDPDREHLRFGDPDTD
jgi:hypothetical protein